MTNQPLLMGQAPERSLSKGGLSFFLVWTAAWWGAVGLVAMMFFFGQLDFVMSARLSLYGISIWLNAWVIFWLFKKSRVGNQLDFYHELMVIWMLSYAVTNVVWEIPWVIFSPHVFGDVNNLADIAAKEPWLRESLLNMWWWALGSFGAVDLRTVNGDGAFYAVEIFAFSNLATTIWFFHLNNKRSPYRYLVAVLGCGEPIAATFIFTFSEVFDHFANMPGGLWDTLLALVWTQYQYFVFPAIFGALGVKLLIVDWQASQPKS